MLNTTVTLTADEPTDSAPVTFGLPLAKGEIENTSQIKVALGSIELAVDVSPGLLWHGTDFLRSITINAQVNMSLGDVVLTITGDGGTSRKPYSKEEWISAGPDKADLKYPRVLALHDLEYLRGSGIVPPFSEVSQKFIDYLDGQFLWSGPLVYSEMGKSDWLFDRPSAYFKAYMATGDPRYLKEAILSKQYYFNHIETAGEPKAAGGRGGCFIGGAKREDGKYIYTQPAKLCLALVGDSSQWNNSLINDMAIQADLGWNQYPTDDPHDNENEGFTERGAGLVGLCELNAYEITGNQAILDNMNTRIVSLKDMQQKILPWDTANDWPNSGAFDHNVMVHEGMDSQSTASIGSTNDHGFSPWMSENIADFLWQTYWLTGNQNIPEMLRLLGNAVNEFGYTTSYNSVTGEFDSKGFVDSRGLTQHTHDGNTRGADTDMLYFGSAQADMATLVSKDWWGWFTGFHGIESVLTLGVAYYFETDAVLRSGLKARIEAILEGSLNDRLAAMDGGGVSRRLFNWQHRSGSVSIWEWILKNAFVKPSDQDEPDTPDLPDTPNEPDEPTEPVSNAPIIRITGKNSAYWYVTVDGVESSKHSSEMEAGEHGGNAKMANRDKEVLILHNGVYTVTVSNLPE